MQQLDGNTAIAVTADTGELECQANALIKSIETVAPNAEVITFIPESSMDEISNKTVQNCEAAGRVVWGEIPILEYPISALVQAYVEAERLTDREYLIALDTDTFLMNPMEIPEAGTVWVRPADVGAQYWCSTEARKDWAVLTSRFDISEPTNFDSRISSVDETRIPPYWNSGVVVTRDRTLPHRWLKYTKALYYEDDLPVSQSEFFIDQVSLSLATRENDVVELSEQMNYPLGGRIFVPDDVSILHYGDCRNLNRIPPGKVRKRIKNAGLVDNLTIRDLSRSILDVLSTKSGKLMSYSQKEKLRRFLLNLLSDYNDQR